MQRVPSSPTRDLLPNLLARLEKVFCDIQDDPGMERRSDRAARMEQDECSASRLQVFRPSLCPACSYSVSAYFRDCTSSVLNDKILTLRKLSLSVLCFLLYFKSFTFWRLALFPIFHFSTSFFNSILLQNVKLNM